MLAVKETAYDCKLDCFVEVFCLTLKTFFKVTVNPIYTGIFGAPWGYQSRQKKKTKTKNKTKKNKKKQVSLSLIATESFFE